MRKGRGCKQRKFLTAYQQFLLRIRGGALSSPESLFTLARSLTRSHFQCIKQCIHARARALIITSIRSNSNNLLPLSLIVLPSSLSVLLYHDFISQCCRPVQASSSFKLERSGASNHALEYVQLHFLALSRHTHTHSQIWNPSAHTNDPQTIARLLRC